MLALAFLLIVALAITWFVHLFIVGAPYVPTPRRVVRAMVQAAAIRDGDVVVDLGAGDARLMTAAAKAASCVEARGCEIVPTVWLLGKVRSWFSQKPIRLRLGSLFSEDLRDADVVFVYLLPPMILQLEEKFTRELKPGTRIVSQTFPLPYRTPVSVTQARTWRGKASVYLYRW